LTQQETIVFKNGAFMLFEKSAPAAGCDSGSAEAKEQEQNGGWLDFSKVLVACLMRIVRLPGGLIGR
jgi:hypothetical protein